MADCAIAIECAQRVLDAIAKNDVSPLTQDSINDLISDVRVIRSNLGPHCFDEAAIAIDALERAKPPRQVLGGKKLWGFARSKPPLETELLRATDAVSNLLRLAQGQPS